MRTKIDTFSKTCPECGTRNRLHIFTTGFSPSWRIACSNCIAVIIEPRTRHAGWSLAPVSDPIADVVVLSGNMPKRRTRPTLLRRMPSLPLSRSTGGRLPRKYTAAGMLTACALVFAAFMGGPALIGDDPAEIGAKGGADGSGGELLAAATGTRDGKEALGQAEAMPENGAPSVANAPPPEVILRASLDGAPRIPHARIPHDRRSTSAPHPVNLASDDLRDPRESMAELQDSVFRDPVAAALSEAALDLSPAERRSLQQRLHLASHDTKGVDGIFGSATRAAIAEWQSQAGLAPTGFATRPTVTRLVAETEAAYHAWHRAEIARRNSEQRLALTMPVPRPDAASRSSTCPRTITGEIAYGQSFACDVRGLGENLKSIKRNFAQAFVSSEPARSRNRGPGDA
ncbi:MAG TPA: peptidoglycan-binding protein [Paracoccaceae bacterium]|nr:peptidoglycan-binding protein [Paracoccaceae bacterium]